MREENVDLPLPILKLEDTKDHQGQGGQVGAAMSWLAGHWDGLVMPGGPYLRVVVPHWHRKETHGPHIPHPALGAVMASSGAILKHAAGVLLRPQAERQARRGLSPAPSLSTFFCYRATATNTKLTG